MTGILLETDRLTLREFTDDDVDLLVMLDSDPEVMHFITGGLPTCRAEIERVVLPRWLRYDEEDPGFGFWKAEDRETAAFERPDVQYAIERSEWPGPT